MEKVQVLLEGSIKERSYEITIGSGVLTRLSNLISLESYSKVALLTDSVVGSIYGEEVRSSLPADALEIDIPPGEVSKNLMTYDYVLNKLAAASLDRKSLLLNMGGGVIGDLGGFVAATYMRGIDFIQIPTTLLSQVDASVGGKTGVNFAGVKNLVGAFSQPKAVLIDVDTLTSLPKRELRSGFAEILKHGFIADKEYIASATTSEPGAYTTDEMIALVKRSCEIKAEVVQADEKESGYRKVLNFGHTIGHAYESLSHEQPELFPDGPLHHGEAVSIGMIGEAYLSLLNGKISQDEMSKVRESLSAVGLPVTAPKLDEETLLAKMKSDKKNQAGEIRWTLLDGLGSATVDQIVPEDDILKAVSYLTQCA